MGKARRSPPPHPRVFGSSLLLSKPAAASIGADQAVSHGRCWGYSTIVFLKPRDCYRGTKSGPGELGGLRRAEGGGLGAFVA